MLSQRPNCNDVHVILSLSETKGMVSKMNRRTITKEQEELLCRISVNEERIRNGRLLDWQEEILNQYDYAMQYLGEKYPSYQFRIMHCEPKNKLNTCTTFKFTEEHDVGKSYSMYIYEESAANAAYSAQDNYYGALKEREYAEKLMKLICEKIPYCIETNTKMSCAMGIDYGENLDLNQLLNGQLQLHQNTSITLLGAGRTESEFIHEVKKVKQLIKERGISGSFIVKLVDPKNHENILFKDNFFG